MMKLELGQAVVVFDGAYNGLRGVVANCDPLHSCETFIVIIIPGVGYVQLPCWYISPAPIGSAVHA